jgi:two-component system sensor histidine kinase BaeS
VSDAISGNRSLAAEGGVELERRVQEDLPSLEADGTRLLRLLNNLLSNGIRHTPPQGRVRITAELDGDVMQIEVVDTGEGIDREDLERLFDRYYRGKDSRTRSPMDSRQGTGLGLAISRAIAHAHGGTLEAISTLGEGTTMRLRLPVK